MDFSTHFPIWDKLTPAQQKTISQTSFQRSVSKGTVLHNGSVSCLGMLLILSGQLRSYLVSDEGREITLYRLFERDVCIFSASCVMQNIQFEVIIEAEKDSEILVLPPHIYKSLMEESAPMANFSNQIMASHFSEVMWLIEQIMWKSLDKRVASFLLEETSIEETNELKITHETIANHLGSHREVITRMLRYFQGEGLVKLSRGKITILDLKKLETLQRS